MDEPVVPVINSLNAPFWLGAGRDQLVLPYCTVAGRSFWPPSPISPFADGGEVEWRPVEPLGIVKALVVYRRSFQKAFEVLMPYGIGLVELGAGPRLQVHIEHSEIEAGLAAGDKVRIRFKQILDAGGKVPVAQRFSAA